MINVLYIDDEIDKPNRDSQHIKSLLEASDEITCTLELPPKDVSNIQLETYDAILIDFDLKTAQFDNEMVNYYGSTLAAEARMRSPRLPVFLISRPSFMGNWQSQLLDQSVDIDAIIWKDDVNRYPDAERSRILAIVSGFRALADVEGKSPLTALHLISTNEDEVNLLREAAPPFEKQQWNIPQMSNWIRNVLIRYPGILYDELNVATRLGISLESFRMHKIQEMFAGAKYQGVFADYGDRWWRNRILSVAQEVILESGMSGAVFQVFGQAFERKTGIKLHPATCVFDGTPTADWVCYILDQPVKQRNSVPYFPDNRPPIMDQARVSFKAILEADDFDHELVDGDSLAIVEQLWK